MKRPKEGKRKGGSQGIQEGRGASSRVATQFSCFLVVEGADLDGLIKEEQSGPRKASRPQHSSQRGQSHPDNDWEGPRASWRILGTSRTARRLARRGQGARRWQRGGPRYLNRLSPSAPPLLPKQQWSGVFSGVRVSTLNFFHFNRICCKPPS